MHLAIRSCYLAAFWGVVFLGAATAQDGEWQGPYGMEIVAASAANLVDGRILSWSAYLKDHYSGSSGQTWVSIFDPATGTSSATNIISTKHDMFCPGTAVLSDGRIMITGGKNAASVTFYDPVTDIWSIGDQMKIPRGYHSMTVLSDGSVFTLGGSWGNIVRGNKHGEMWTPTGGWDLMDNVLLKPDSTLLTKDIEGVYRSDNHMWMFEAPNGLIFHAGPSKQMHWIDTAGEGKIIESGFRGDDTDAMNGNAIMYDIGKILTVGGSPDYSNTFGSERAYVIDINNKNVGKERVSRVGDMAFPRSLANSVVLPSGEVVVVGGLSTEVKIFSDNTAVYNAEIWSPVTEQFTTLAGMVVPRTYHSVAILLKDGRVWAAGGGLCGGCSTNHLDSEILTPPYLLNADGSLKSRPVILSAPSEVAAGDRVVVEMDTTDQHTFALVRLSAVTHSINNDLRRIPLRGNAKGSSKNSVIIDIPKSYSILIPGTYFLFAMNEDGVPSVAEIVSVKPP